MPPKHIFIIDDLNPKPVIGLLSQTYPNAQIQRLREKEAIREHLQHGSPEDTVILLNAHIRFNDGDFRSNFLGMRFLRQELRTAWRRREAVVVYSPLRPDVFLDIPINRILYARVGHYYYHIIKLKGILDIVERAKPIENEAALDEIIERYGGLGSLIRTFKHDIENKLLTGLYPANQSTLAQLERLVQDMVVLIPQRFHQEFQTERFKAEIQQLMDKIRQSRAEELEAHITQIRSILSSYKELCHQFFGVR